MQVQIVRHPRRIKLEARGMSVTAEVSKRWAEDEWTVEVLASGVGAMDPDRARERAQAIITVTAMAEAELTKLVAEGIDEIGVTEANHFEEVTV